MAATGEHEWKKGSAELLILSLLEDQPRHGYEIGSLIDLRSGGTLHFHVGLPVSLAVPARKTGLDSRTLDRKSKSKTAPLLPANH
jgi:hypothetical protein